MFEKIVEMLFFIALFINALLFLPQIFLLLKHKKSEEVSATMFITFNVIQLITIVYGYIKGDRLLMIGYCFSFFTCAIATFLVFFYRR